jgi:hypothetical protein
MWLLPGSVSSTPRGWPEMDTLRVFAGNVVVGDVMIQPYDGSRGVVMEVVAPEWDREHVGLRIATGDAMSNALFHIFDVVTVAS